jgi:hypothetical protein
MHWVSALAGYRPTGGAGGQRVASGRRAALREAGDTHAAGG